MGKGKKPYGAKRTPVDDFDEYASDTSSSTMSRGGAANGKAHGVAPGEADDTVDDTYHDSMEALFEKRATTRTAAYAKLIKYLKADVRAGESEKNCHTLIGRCLDSIRRGSMDERSLAATTLSLHFVSLPEVPENLFSQVRVPLEVASLEGHDAARAVVIDALSMCCFVGVEDEEEARAMMARLQALWSKGGTAVRTAALRGWALLFTQARFGFSSSQVEGLLEGMAVFMTSDKSVEVRAASGEVVALLCSAYNLSLRAWADGTGDDDDDDDGSFVDSEFGDADAVSMASEVPDSLDGLVHRMRDLATHNRADALRTSKRDKAALKATFRSILASVEDGHVKAEKITLKFGNTLCVDTLAGKVALAAFKRLLAGGLQHHLLVNPLLHAVFAFSPSSEAPERMSALEKRHLRRCGGAAGAAELHPRTCGGAHGAAGCGACATC